MQTHFTSKITEETLWITVKEACALFGRSRRSIENAFEKGYIRGRYDSCGATKLISFFSCSLWWGNTYDSILLEEILAGCNDGQDTDTESVD